MSAAPAFRYDSYHLDPARGLLACQYSLGSRSFTERVSFGTGGRWESPVTAAAARLVFLLAGVSYYKTAAPAVIDLGGTAVTDTERDFLRAFYLDGLAEFAYRNSLDLSGLRIEGPVLSGPARSGPARSGPVPNGSAEQPGDPDGRPAAAGRPLVPFGGGIDSIVTVELVRRRAEPALFIVSRPGDRFEAIDRKSVV